MATFSTTAAIAPGWTESEQVLEPRSFFDEAAARFLRNKTGLLALAVLMLLTLSAVFAPLLAHQNPIAGAASQRLLPVGSPGHLLGTDEQGRDMFARLLYGGRLSLTAGIAPVLISALIGTLIGALAGYNVGWGGSIIMRVMDMFYAFPPILLAIAVAASLGPGLTSVIISLSVVRIPTIARVAEAATRKVIVLEYIEAARLSGANTFQVIGSQLLLNIFNPIFVYVSGLVGLSIIIASSLSFLGLGPRPPAPEWGYMLNSLRGSIYVNPLVAALPGVFIFATSIAFNTLADAIRDSLDVRAD
jgi:peptide/nickel transport system permease protein